jgi:hypothetical protein
MATRLYPVPGSTSPVAPAFSAEWESTVDAVRRNLVTVKTDVGFDDYLLNVADANFSVNKDTLHYQLISAPIAAGPITGTFVGQFYANESDVAFNLRSQALVKVVSNDGATVRGVLYAGDLSTLTGDPTNEFTGSYSNHQYPRGGPISLSTVVALLNDRVVAEIGFRQHQSAFAVGTTVISDDTAIGDLANTEATDVPGPPTKATWVEFSVDLFTTRVGPVVRAYILE